LVVCFRHAPAENPFLWLQMITQEHSEYRFQR
jgi:hypothetical protein